MVMPAYDAMLSNTVIAGSKQQYVPRSLPCITNQALFCALLVNYSEVGIFDTTAAKWQLRTANYFPIKPSYYTEARSLNPTFPTSALTESQLPRDGFDFKFKNNVPFLTLTANQVMYVRLTQIGRYWYTILRGLGYTCDPLDTRPVSILPPWAFARAYYDIYYPKRYNPWLSIMIVFGSSRKWNNITH